MAPAWHRWQLTAPLAALSRPVRTSAPPKALSAPAAKDPAGDAGRAPAHRGTPVVVGGAPARQVDGTTCGSAVLVLLAVTADPALAAWLETGWPPAGEPAGTGLPPEVPPDGAEDLDAAARFAAAQQRVQRATGRRALGPLPWPAAFGTPPWTAAREARFPGVRYRVRPVDDARADAAAVLTAVANATRRGIPVPLYTGGDLRSGPTAAVPRHVVLAVPPPPAARGADAGVLHLYEPSAGTVFRVRLADLLGRTEPHPALGGWTHVCVALLPVPDHRAPGPHPGQTGRAGQDGAPPAPDPTDRSDEGGQP